MLGSDYPYAWEFHPADHILGTDTLTDKQKAAILGDNASRVQGIKA